MRHSAARLHPPRPGWGASARVGAGSSVGTGQVWWPGWGCWDAQSRQGPPVGAHGGDAQPLVPRWHTQHGALSDRVLRATAPGHPFPHPSWVSGPAYYSYPAVDCTHPISWAQSAPGCRVDGFPTTSPPPQCSPGPKGTVCHLYPFVGPPLSEPITSLEESRASPAAELSCQPQPSAHFQLGFRGGVLGQWPFPEAFGYSGWWVSGTGREASGPLSPAT